MNFSRLTICLLIVLPLLGVWSSVDAALPKETKDKIGEIRKELGEVTKLLRDDDLEGANLIIEESATALEEIVTQAGPENANDRTILSAKKYLFDQKVRYLKEKGVVFSQDIAPILSERCLRCHGDRASGGLELSSYASMGKGGRSGALLVPKNARRSLIMGMLTHPDETKRMPKGGSQLSDEELLLISTWIDLGVPYDGDNPQTLLGDLIRNATRPKMAPVEIPKPTGKETVSFTNDIAPFMSRLCLGCHSGNEPNGGLSLETFERMMQGGDSGRVIIPGNLEGSRMFRLVGGLENPRMPQGQARITRQNYEDIKKWFEEGNKFDGDSIKTPLRQLVPSEDDLKANELSKLSPEEWEAHRLERTEDQWKRTLPKERSSQLEGTEFLIWGNVSQERIKQVDQLAHKQFTQLKAMFNDTTNTRAFKGRLTIFLFKDRVGYEEFLYTVERQEPERGMIGHAKVTSSFDDAYIALEDVGDDPETGVMNLETSLVTQLTDAYMKKTGADLPVWVTKGTGLYLASQSGDAAYFRTLPAIASEALTTVTRPEQIFAGGAFSPSQTSAVGYTLAKFLIQNGGAKKFGQFIARLRNGSTVDAATKAVYQSDARSIAVGYSQTLPKP